MYSLQKEIKSHKVAVESSEENSRITTASWIDGWPYDRSSINNGDSWTSEQVETECEMAMVEHQILGHRLTRETWIDRSGDTHFWRLVD